MPLPKASKSRPRERNTTDARTASLRPSTSRSRPITTGSTALESATDHSALVDIAASCLQRSVPVNNPSSLEDIAHGENVDLIHMGEASIVDPVLTEQTALPYRCPKCGKAYKSSSGLLRHSRTCGNERTSCQFCDRTFKTYSGVRFHETKAHAEDIAKQAEQSETMPEHEALSILARIEAETPKGHPFYRLMSETTGLTVHQIRHRREKPIYQEFLSKATANYRRQLDLPQETPSSTTTPSPHRSPRPTVSPRIANLIAQLHGSANTPNSTNAAARPQTQAHVTPIDAPSTTTQLTTSPETIEVPEDPEPLPFQWTK